MWKGAKEEKAASEDCYQVTWHREQLERLSTTEFWGPVENTRLRDVQPEGQGGWGIYLPAFNSLVECCCQRVFTSWSFQPARPTGKTAFCSLRGSPPVKRCRPWQLAVASTHWSSKVTGIRAGNCQRLLWGLLTGPCT